MMSAHQTVVLCYHLSASTLVGRLSTEFRGLFIYFLTIFPGAHLWVQTLMLGEKAWVIISVLIQFCAGQSNSSTSNLLICVSMDFALCTDAQSCWKRKGTSTNISHKVGGMKLFKLFWYAKALRVSFTETKGPSPTPEKQPHNIPEFGLISTVYLETTKPRLVH